jgi:TonB family protein
MAGYPRQYEDGGFTKTFVVVGGVHLLLLGGLLLAALHQPDQSNESVVWMSPGSFAGDSPAVQALLNGNRKSAEPVEEEANQPAQPESDQRDEPAPPPPATPSPLPPPAPMVEESAPPIASPTPAATPSPRPTPTPTPRSAPTAKPTPKSSPKPAPKATPKLTPKPSPTHSATPKPTPKTEVAPKEKEKEKPKTDDSPKPNSSGSDVRKPELGQGKGKLPHDQTTPGRDSQAHSGNGNGAGGSKASGDSALAAYVGILSSRFQAAWNQPTSEMALGKTLAVTVKLKVEADGTVTEFVIAEGSGNAVVDESVREAGKKITRLPPPPNGQAFSAPVRFELGN